ncbi:MAG: penicillin-binding protein 2 [Hyphomicrobium sp.]|nr:penicillin-binding protein 2 [Hyphomicrobium sp.]
MTMTAAGRSAAATSAFSRQRSRFVALVISGLFTVVAAQLVWLAASADRDTGARISMITAEPATNVARPDIVDRHGRLLATDVQVPSLAADPGLVFDADETAEKLAQVLPDLDAKTLRKSLGDRKRFVWVRRALSPRLAQKIHNLGLPGIFLRDEVRRTYPSGRIGGHVLGQVDIDNKGLTGLERWLDAARGIETVHAARLSTKAPLRLSLDVGVSHAVEDELEAAIVRYDAKAAAGIVMDASSGEVVASVSLPGVDPMLGVEVRDPDRIDRVNGGVYELGSVLKLMTIAMALEQGKSPESLVDTTAPLRLGRYEIADLHPLGRPMSVSEVFIHSSNVGAGLLALEAGADRQRGFLQRLGLLDAIDTELGTSPRPLVPDHFGRTEQVTIAYGHGLAVTPLQLVAATAGLINGGRAVRPTFVARDDAAPAGGPKLVGADTSRRLRDLMRLNVTDGAGTGRRADVPGYDVGGKTGTAEIAAKGGYRKKSVISSFLGAFPMSAPRYVTLVMLFEPRGVAATDGEVTAGRNAAPTTARIVARIAPLLGVAAAVPGG